MRILILFIGLFLLFPLASFADSDITSRLSGRILLQVEDSGEAWYVNPVNKNRYFLGRPSDAFRVMRELGLGISEKNFNSFNGVAPKNLSGRILLRVEANGEAYYVNPVDLKLHFLNRPADAFSVMRNLGLGITNKNLEKIKDVNTEDKDIVNNLDNTKINQNVCLQWDYSDWGECSDDGNSKRDVLKSYPLNCSGGSPITMKTCKPLCKNFSYSPWSDCSSNGLQFRDVLSSFPNNCIGGDAILSQKCTHTTPGCSFKYSKWSECSYSQQTRTVSKYPENCVGSNTEPLVRECASPVVGFYSNYELAYDFETKKMVSIFSKTKQQWAENNAFGGYYNNVNNTGAGTRVHPITMRMVDISTKTAYEWGEFDRFIGKDHSFYASERKVIKNFNGNCAIKGNVSFHTGEKIYHLPECDSYDDTIIDEKYGEKWFCTEADAIKSGFRRAQNCPCNVKGFVDIKTGKITKYYPWQDEYKNILIDNRFGGRWFCE